MVVNALEWLMLKLSWGDETKFRLRYIYTQKVFFQQRLFLATCLWMNTDYNGQSFLWEVDYIEHMHWNTMFLFFLCFCFCFFSQCSHWTSFAVSSAGECNWKVDFLANFVKRKKSYVKKVSSFWLPRVLLSKNCQNFC